MKFKKHIYILVLLSITFSINAQKKEYTGNPDTSFLNARTLAFAGEREQARDTLKIILSKYPNYTDVKTLLAKTLTWDERYYEARIIYNQIISREKKNEEVWVAAINNEMYSENYHTALGLCNKALLNLKDNQGLTILRNKALVNLDHLNESKDRELETTIGASVRVDYFNVVYDPMYYASFSYVKETKIGRFIPSINYSKRFNVDALQYQFDAYPSFGDKFYSYVSYAYSNAPTFPDHRLGVEMYSILPKAMEASLGFRFINFNKTKTTILTGSFTLYTGDYYFSWRPYVNPNAEGGTSFSNNFSVRKYKKDRNNFLSLSFGFGFSPELTQITEENVLLSETLLYLESQSLSLGYNYTSKKMKNPIGLGLEFTRQELVFDPGEFYFSVSGRLSYQFNL